MVIIGVLSLLSLGLIVFYTWYLGISPMPSAYKAKRELLKLLPDDVSGKIYELGAGWGTLARPLADAYPHHHVIAYELSLIPYLFSWIMNVLSARKNLRYARTDFFEVELTAAGLIVCYLYPGAMARLKSKFENELKAGTWIISNTFALPGEVPVKTVEVVDLYRTKIYLYRWRNL